MSLSEGGRRANILINTWFSEIKEVKRGCEAYAVHHKKNPVRRKKDRRKNSSEREGDCPALRKGRRLKNKETQDERFRAKPSRLGSSNDKQKTTIRQAERKSVLEQPNWGRRH